MGAHLLACAECRRELERFRETLTLIDRAQLAEMATLPAPGDWDSLRSALTAAGRQGAVWRAPMLKAAAVVLLAGATFLIGRYWDRVIPGAGTEVGGGAAVAAPEGSAALLNPQTRVARFVAQTEGYLRKSHLVLMEFANGDASQDPVALTQSCRSLLKETRKAEQVAAQLADQRIVGLVSRLNAALGAVAALDGTDAASRDHARRMINESGVLEELEILETVSGTMAMERTRT